MRKRLLHWLTCLCVITGSLVFMPHTVHAVNDFATIRRDTKGTVIQVIDGDALKLTLTGSGQQVLVRLAGIATLGYNDAQTYMTAQLLGREVEIYLDEQWDGILIDRRWTPAYVYLGDVLYNRVLLQKGFAQTDESYNAYTLYNTFVNDERTARNRRVGMWGAEQTVYNVVSSAATVSTTSSSQTYNGETRVNINTATAAQIRQHLGLSASAARLITQYRETAPFNSGLEVKYTGAFTRDQFTACASRLVVCTNINTATLDELYQLPGIGTYEARAIMDYRGRSPFTNTTQLYSEGFIAYATWQEIAPYIATREMDTLAGTSIYKTANINYDTADAIYEAGAPVGLTTRQARSIVDARSNGYTYKSVGEIIKISGIGLSTVQIHHLANRLYVDTAYGSYVNLNTATYEILNNAGFTQGQITAVERARRMDSGRALPFNLGTLNTRISLYTNINTATASELQTLSVRMSASFAYTLTSAAYAQPFGTADELSTFFASYNEQALYNEIADYIVFR